jgi:outer membrane protein TolC
MNSSRAIVAAILFSLVLAGCANVRTTEEKTARRSLSEVESNYRPDGKKPELPVLSINSPATDYLRFALLNHPRVEATYYDWRSAVAAIAPARALPDPQLTFQADITDTVMSLMPGLMFDIMASAKRAAMGREASIASESAYRSYATALVSTTAELRKAWVELSYVDEAVAIRRQMAGVLDQALASAQADYSTGRGMGTMEEQTKVLNAAAKLKSDLGVFADRQLAARARFKAALGLSREEPDPVWPSTPWPSAPLPSEDELWKQALAANPSLGSMRTMVDMAVSQVQIAHTGKIPDFTAGLMVDTKADPLMFRPTATVTLPIWRGKIKAAIESAEARRLAAQARLSSEQIGMAAELAQMLFMIREADRMLSYIDSAGLPNIINALRSAESAYGTGMSGFAPLAELRLMELAMRIERVDARRERELAVADLASFVATDVPTDAHLTTSNYR